MTDWNSPDEQLRVSSTSVVLRLPPAYSPTPLVRFRCLQETRLCPLRYLCLGICQYHACRKGPLITDPAISVGPEYVGHTVLISSPISPGSRSPVLSLPVFPALCAHRFVSQGLSSPPEPYLSPPRHIRFGGKSNVARVPNPSATVVAPKCWASGPQNGYHTSTHFRCSLTSLD